jgi:hypothetical protein
MRPALALAFVLAGCGDGTRDASSDASGPDTPAPDVFEPLGIVDNEGGEIRLESTQQATAAGAMQSTARAHAYFYKSQTPSKFALPAFPGCVDLRSRTTWPLAQGTIVPLDVGGVTIKSTGSDLVMTREEVTPPTSDPLGRPHALWFKKDADLPANDGDTFLPPNQTYDIVLAGSAEWPAQTIADVAFMPAAWTPISPPVDGTTMLAAGTDLTLTHTPVPSSNLPAGYRVDMTVMFTGTGHTGPIVMCQEQADGSLTVPAALVDVLRAYSPGRYQRQLMTHALFELKTSAPLPPGVRKRVDVLSIQSYNSAWAAQ